MDNRRQSGLWDHNAQTGEFERKAVAGPYQYYKQPTTSSDKRRSFLQRSADPASDVKEDAYRAATKDDGVSVVHRSRKDQPTTLIKLMFHTLSRTRQEHHNTYDDDEDDEIPENLRRKAWSPEPESPVLPEKDLPTRHASNASQHIRRGSVPDRSPLQHLEAKLGDMGKEEKRARMEEAERKMIHKDPDTIGGASNENRRSISDAGRRSEDSKQQRRSVSDDIPRKSQSHRRTESGSEKFRRATDALRSGLNDDNSVEPDSYFASTARSVTNPSREVNSHTSKSEGRRDGHSARSSAGMSTATTIAGAAFENDAAARGKAAHERRRERSTSQKSNVEPRASKQSTVKPLDIDSRGASWGPSTGIPASPTSTRTSGEIQRTRSKKLQKQPPPGVYQPTTGSNSRRPESSRSSDTAQPLSDRTNADQGKNKSSLEPLEPDIITRDAVKTGSDVDVPYSIPPQTKAGRQAKERVSFAPDVVEQPEREDANKHRFHDMFSDHHVQARGYQSKVAALDEWKSAKTLKLSAADLLLDDGHESNRDSAWWESKGRRPPQSTSARNVPYEEQATSFDPPLFLKCGPLLRFTGLRKEQSVATTWRGSIMILTEDESSDYDKRQFYDFSLRTWSCTRLRHALSMSMVINHMTNITIMTMKMMQSQVK
ncbi:hypothetical protein MRB53_041434 [Persea americana]|nr:hypothetical protein MRB53_041434 [Persea americana]